MNKLNNYQKIFLLLGLINLFLKDIYALIDNRRKMKLSDDEQLIWLGVTAVLFFAVYLFKSSNNEK